MNTKKTILITGSTGGIGGELARQLLTDGYELYLPVRTIEKAQELIAFPNAHVEKCSLESYEEVQAYMDSMIANGIFFEYVLPLAGDLRKDSNPMFIGNTPQEKVDASIEHHMRANVLTFDTVMAGLERSFGEKLKDTTLLVMSSWAAHFAKDNPYRINEEGYVVSKNTLSTKGVELKNEKKFKEVLIEEPALIDTPMTRREFPELIADPNVPKQSPEQYVKHLRDVLHI